MIAANFAPARSLLLVFALNVLAAMVATWTALSQPWLGLQLRGEADGTVRIAATAGPAEHLPVGVLLRGLRSGSEAAGVALEAADLMEEPDQLPDYEAMDAFFARQTRLAALLSQPTVRLDLRAADGAEMTSVVAPARRPLSALPVSYWYQVVVAALGCMIATWVWVLRPRDWGARMFAATGLLFPLFVLPAAVYSSRELALPGDLFFALSAANHLAAFLFGAALIGIFLCHPRPLVRPRHLAIPPLIFAAWWLADVLRLAPDLDWGNRYPVMTEMLLATAAALLQWRRSQGDPRDRAALRWLILSLLLGSGLFIFTIIASVSLGWIPALSQGYAFGFFLLIYVGIALGLGRYRLFELDRWAYRVLLWAGGAILVIALDALLVAGLNLAHAPSLGLALLASGWVYFPARQWLWQRLAEHPKVGLQTLLPELVEIAFSLSPGERARRWRGLLQRLYDPLEVLPVSTGTGAVTAVLKEDGLAMEVFGPADMPALRLRHAASGRRLFAPADARFVDALCHLMAQADAGRDAYERGASEERKRIARDMHDDVGARLLTLIHRADSPALADVARAAMTDLRTALGAMDSHATSLVDALADWREEAAERCDAAGIDLRWLTPPPPTDSLLTPRQKAVIERALREAISNAIRHARPRKLTVAMELAAGWLKLHIDDDGETTPPETWRQGRGLRGMQQRLAEAGGRLRLSTLAGRGTRVALEMQMEAP